MKVLAIDPGNKLSAYALIDSETCRPLLFDKIDNDRMLKDIRSGEEWTLSHDIYIEQIASYGMAVGETVFETCVFTGRLLEAFYQRNRNDSVTRIKRAAVKLHHCRSPKANDSTIRQALVDRFAPGEYNHGKGTRKDPGWFFGFRADVWAAYSIATMAADELHKRVYV